MTGIIILAAGASSRLGRAKQLLLFNGKSLLRHALEAALGTSADRIVVVTGAYHDSLLPELEMPDLLVVRNDDWKEGMASSIRLGMEMLLNEEPALSAILIILSDQPLIRAHHLNQLIAGVQNEGFNLAATEYNKIRGVPACFGRELFQELRTLKGDRGAYHLFNSGSVKVIPSAFASIDIDTAEDYKKLLDLQE